MKNQRRNPAKNGYLCYKKKDGTIVGKFHVVLPKTLIDRIHEDADKKGFGTRNKWFVDHLMKHFGMIPGKGVSPALADHFMVAPAHREDSSQ